MTRALLELGRVPVPKGDVAAGVQLVPRILAGNGGDGFVLQGDNNDEMTPSPAIELSC